MSKLARIPLGVTAAWITAVEAADCRCQCTETVKGHSHARTEGRCRASQNETGGRLHLLGDGLVMCHPCASHRERTTQATQPHPADAEQESLFDLTA